MELLKTFFFVPRFFFRELLIRKIIGKYDLKMLCKLESYLGTRNDFLVNIEIFPIIFLCK